MIKYKRGRKREGTKIKESKRGQINIEFAGGAILFFVTLIFLLGTVLSNIPKHNRQAETNQLSLVSQSMTDKMINHKGAWNDAGSPRSDWEDHPGQLVSFGLAQSYHRLAEDKIAAMQADLDKYEVQTALGLNQSRIRYNLSLIRLIPVKTVKTFQKGNGSIYGLDEPDPLDSNSFDQDYGLVGPIIHYGARVINGNTQHLLVGQDNTGNYWYWISPDTNFENGHSDDYHYRVEAREVYIGSETYQIGQRSGLDASQGNLIVFQTKILDHGFKPPSTTESIVQNSRYASLGNDTVKLITQVWQQ